MHAYAYIWSNITCISGNHTHVPPSDFYIFSWHLPSSCGDGGVHHPWMDEDARLPAEISRYEGSALGYPRLNNSSVISMIKNSIFIGYSLH